MARRAITRFHLYRYQLLPVDRHFQGDLYGAATVEDLISKKNHIFAEALSSSLAFTGGRTQTATQRLVQADDLLLYRIAANRSLQHETRDFKTEVIDNWPKILLVIWNAPDKQLIAVQHRANAFQDTQAVLKLVFDSVEPVLAKNQLTALYEPLFEKKVFWDLVERHKGKIQEVDFELVTPNMANISGVLPENLKQFAKRTNAVKSHVAIASDPGSSLKLDQSDPLVNALVDYSSQGGGDIAIRLAGIKKLLHTSRTVREVTVDEAVLKGTPENVASLLQELLK
ncbi:hypothetical protein [Rubrivivax gelatinosus]|uniref:Uncharacterized protein n=2 Tax=Rubrivivax gelatinosus TaxID=28068 RepID=A0ABS1DXN1_RUBGE|nr:hypothetical protein [Rubrivivax gelatinosus]MBK1714847.1 hypothetical protein [Rubrivivax gelatinosus]